MANNKPYITVIHSNPEITDVKNFVDQGGISPASEFRNNIIEFLNYEGGTGKTNRQRIKEQYIGQEVDDNATTPDRDLLLKVGTRLLIPKEKINAETLVAEGNQVEETNDYTAFLADRLRDLLQDPRYESATKVIDKKIGVAKDIYPNITVWIWCRGMSSDGDESLQGTLLDVSPFIQSVTTGVGENGGNFQLILSPLICEPDPNQGWIIKKDTIKNYFSNNLKNNYTATSQLHNLGKGDDGQSTLKRNQFFFHNIINSNDLVFIRFETLQTELKDRSQEDNRFVLNNADIPNKIYDMIGLVDSNSISVVPGSNEVGISISGRDLTKVIIDDGAYFFPLEFAQGIFIENQDNDKLLKRIFGRFETLSAYIDRSIQFSLRFIINQLANTGLVPDSLFEAYGERRSTYFIEDRESALQRTRDVNEQGTSQTDTRQFITEEVMDGVWQIIKLIIDESITNRRIVDSSISEASGSLITHIKKVCQEPFVQFYTDTYGDQFYFIVRQPPFTKEAFLALIRGDVQTEGIQEGVSSPQGNTFFADETGNTPTENVLRPKNEIVIDIEEEDVIIENLGYYDGEVFSWYQLTPQGLFFGQGSEVTLAYLPAIYFSEYSDIWGSRPLQIVTNYVPFIPVVGDKQDLSQGYFERQAFRDLKFLIDIHSYLPFTRKGTITINGDRRIKVGTVVRLKSTNEIFYVDGVSQTYTIAGNVDRVTTLQVSRGMVEQYIEGRNVDGIEEKVSYFNIINTELEENFSTNQEEVTVDEDDGTTKVVFKNNLNADVLKNWKVNKDVFNFFLRRDQLK